MSVGKIFKNKKIVLTLPLTNALGMVAFRLRAHKAVLELSIRKSQGANAKRNEKEMKHPFSECDIRWPYPSPNQSRKTRWGRGSKGETPRRDISQ